MTPDTGIGAASWVCTMASRRNGTLYAGVTSDLQGRVREHKSDVYPIGFTARYGCKSLVWHETLENIVVAIAGEKAVKKHGRKRKLVTIEADNPDRNDLFDDLYR